MVTKELILEKLDTDVRWLERAILAIDRRQTQDERQDGETKHRNGMGWNGTDAGRGGYLASYIRNSRRPEGQRLTGKWVETGRRLIRKYVGQLLLVAQEREAA